MNSSNHSLKHGGLILAFSAAAVFAANVLLTPLLPSATPAPTLTDEFKCTQTMPGYVADRMATVVTVHDHNGAAQHVELRLDRTGHEYDGGSRVSVVHLGTAPLPAGDAGLKAGVQEAGNYCMHGTAPANTVAAYPNAFAPS